MMVFLWIDCKYSTLPKFFTARPWKLMVVPDDPGNFSGANSGKTSRGVESCNDHQNSRPVAWTCFSTASLTFFILMAQGASSLDTEAFPPAPRDLSILSSDFQKYNGQQKTARTSWGKQKQHHLLIHSESCPNALIHNGIEWPCELHWKLLTKGLDVCVFQNPLSQATSSDQKLKYDSLRSLVTFKGEFSQKKNSQPSSTLVIFDSGAPTFQEGVLQEWIVRE